MKPEELGQVLSQAQPLPIAVVVISVLFSLLTRVFRWQVLFLPDRRVRFGPLFSTLAISYMASTFLPLRAGELVRAVFLGQRESIAIPRIVGTILLEKLFDFLAIGVMLALLVALAPMRPELQVGAGSIASVILIGFGFVVALAVWREPTLRLVGVVERLVPLGLGRRLQLAQATRQFAEGTDSLRVPQLWLPLLGWTTVTWLSSAATSWAGCLALGVQPGLPALLFLMVLTSSGQAVPSSPGYVGVYHYLATVALTTFGVDYATALGIALIVHAFSYGSLVIVGLIALWTGGYTLGDVLTGVRGRGWGGERVLRYPDPLVRDSLTWYVVVQVAGLAVWPLVARALAPLEDRGWAVSKVAGLLLIAWLVWLGCMLTPLPFTQLTLAVALAGVGAAAWIAEWRGGGWQPLVDWLKLRRRLLLAWESVFLATFVLFAVLRSHDPALSSAEKPMDMAFLNGFMTAQSLPTQDTWLAGFGEPYYYFGYFVLACVGKLSGVAPGVAYNLAAAVVPALAAATLASLAWSLARAASVQPIWAAAGSSVATGLALFCGNLTAFFEFLFSRGLIGADAGETLGIKNFAQGVTVGVWPPTTFLWWFKSARVIPNLQPDGITEFPFFSALWSDLHPHFVALPFELLVLCVAATHVLTRGASLRSVWTQGLGALALGGLLVINTWDIAPFWLLYVGLSLYAAYFSHWRWRWYAAALTPLGGAVLYLPYFVGYSGPPLGLGVVLNERTPLGSLLVLFGWAIVLLAALGLFTRWCIGDRRGRVVVGVGAALGLAIAILGQPGMGVLVALLATLLPWPGVLARFDPAAAIVLGIGAFAAAMLLGVEVVFLDDVFHSRMNTVFKFHENAWLLAGLASGVGLALVGRFTRRARWVVAACACAFLLGGLVYPLSAIATRMREQPPGGPSLDGVAFLSPDERAAVRWLAGQNGPAGRVVVAEGLGNEYDASAAGMATYSGAVTVLGWAGHELQWRGPLVELGTRTKDLADLYRDAPIEAIRSVLDRYGVRFVVVGNIERKVYGEGVTSRFDGVLQVAFRSGDTVIYRSH